MIRLLARLLAAVLFSKEPERTYCFHSVQTSWYQVLYRLGSCRTENKYSKQYL